MTTSVIKFMVDSKMISLIAKLRDGYLIVGDRVSSETYSKDVYFLHVDMEDMIR